MPGLARRYSSTLRPVSDAVVTSACRMTITGGALPRESGEAARLGSSGHGQRRVVAPLGPGAGVAAHLFEAQVPQHQVAVGRAVVGLAVGDHLVRGVEAEFGE